MASTAGIIPRVFADPCSTTITLTFETTGPQHYYLLWSNETPAKRPRYVIIRGIERQCGFKWVVEDWNCVEQQEAGDSITHSWNFSEPFVGRKIYFMLSESCSPRRGFITTAPLVYELSDCSPGMRAYRVIDHTGTALPIEPAFGAATFQQIDYDTDSCVPSLPTAVLRFCGQGTFTVRLDCDLSLSTGFPNQPQTAVVGIRQGSDLSVLGIQNLEPGQTIHVSFIRDFYHSSVGVSTFQVVGQTLAAPWPFRATSINPPLTVSVAPEGWPTPQGEWKTP